MGCSFAPKAQIFDISVTLYLHLFLLRTSHNSDDLRPCRRGGAACSKCREFEVCMLECTSMRIWRAPEGKQHAARVGFLRSAWWNAPPCVHGGPPKRSSMGKCSGLWSACWEAIRLSGGVSQGVRKFFALWYRFQNQPAKILDKYSNAELFPVKMVFEVIWVPKFNPVIIFVRFSGFRRKNWLNFLYLLLSCKV